MNARNTGRNARRNANASADADAPASQDATHDAPQVDAPQVDAPATPDADAPQAAEAETPTRDQPADTEPDTDAPAADSATAQAAGSAAPTPDATDAPDETAPATPLTESDDTVTPSNPEQPAEAPAQAETPATPASAPETAPAETPEQMFSRMLATATAVTIPDLSVKLQAFATAVTITRNETLRIIADRKEDEIVRTVTLSARPDSSSGRGPTLAKVQGTIAQLIGGAGYVSHGNCHDSTKRNPIYGHVVIPEAGVPFWNALWTAMDAPAGPFRTAEASTKQVNRAGMTAGTAIFKTRYEAENRLSRVNMINTAYNLAALVPAIPATDEAAITAMRDAVAAVTAEFTRVTSVAFIPKGPTYVIAPTDAYAVKADITPAAPVQAQVTVNA